MITLTDAAARHIMSVLTPGKVVLVGVLGGGCAGFEYDLNVIDMSEIGNADKMTSQGIDFYVDAESLMYLLGTEIDYKATMLSSQFIFKNPLSTMSCGCGTSFSI